MEGGTKEYKIVINGLEHSIEQVKALNTQLDALEERINALEKKSINISSNVSTSNSTSSNSRTSELGTEDKLLKQIQATEEKIANARREDYQSLLAQKDILKDITVEKKAMAAQERLVVGDYDLNTMQGIKDKLKDIKALMQTTDIGSDMFKELTEDANDLNSKLLDIEKSYGQFHRNVGNYQSAFDGIKKVTVEVGGVAREFSSVRDASRQLSQELKAMVINGQENTEEFRQLSDALHKFEMATKQADSAVNDLKASSKGMDALLDMAESFTAIGQMSQGFSAAFGIDDDEIQRSIQKLVGLQNAMQGLEKIRQQMNTQEGIGGILAKGNEKIDAFVSSLFGLKKAQDAVNAATSAATAAQNASTVATNASTAASNALTAAEGTQTVATKALTVATKGFSLALKAIGIGLVITAVALLIEYWDDLKEAMKGLFPSLKKVGDYFDNVKKVVVGLGNSIYSLIKGSISTLVSVFNDIANGDFKKAWNTIKSQFKDGFGAISGYQKGYQAEAEHLLKQHNKKMADEQKKANEETLKDEEAKYGKSHKRTQEYLKKQLSLTKEGSEEYKDLQRQLWEDERQEREENQKKALASTKKSSQDILEAEKELTRLRISNMKEGLRKTLTQLEEERKAKLAKIKADGVMVAELELETNRYYDEKIEDEKKNHSEKIKKEYKSLYDSVYNMQMSQYKKSIELGKKESEITSRRMEDAKNLLMNQGISSYGIQGKGQISNPTSQSLGLVSTSSDEIVQDYKKLIDIQREYSTAENALKLSTILSNQEIEEAEKKLTELRKQEFEARKNVLNEENNLIAVDYNTDIKEAEENLERLKENWTSNLSLQKTTLEAKLELYNEYNKQLEAKYSEEDGMAVKNALIEEGYTKDLSTMFQQRMLAVNTYWATRLDNEKAWAEKLYEEQIELEKKELEASKKQADEKHKQDEEKLEKWYEDSLKYAYALYEAERDLAIKEAVSEEEKNEKLLEAQTDFENRRNAIVDKYNSDGEILFKTHLTNIEILNKESEQKQVQLENEKNDKLKKSSSEYYQDSLQEFRDYQTAINNLESKQPITTRWGLIDLKKTKANNQEILNSYEQLAAQLVAQRHKLTLDFQNGLIDENVFKSTLREFDSFSADLGEKIDSTKQKLKFGGNWDDMTQSINEYVQMVGNTINSVLESVWDVQDSMYEKEMEELDKSIDAVKNRYQELEAAANEHKSNMESLENDIANAQGDARDRLLERYNAEMEAMRRSVDEKKKAEKEEEKLEKKKEKMELEQKKREKARSLVQAAINAAMAISMAAVNSWPIPAIPMMAAAAAVGAAQIAAISKQKYANGGQLDGGVAQGKRHSEGGIKVLGGRAEIEGGEYITNRISTSKNVELLDYINSRKKRINIGDLIEFYGGDSPIRKNIQTVRTRFADGGVIPTLRNDISLNDRVVQVMEDYANRPTVVEVVDIIDSMDRVRNVQTLAGLSPNY